MIDYIAKLSNTLHIDYHLQSAVFIVPFATNAYQGYRSENPVSVYRLLILPIPLLPMSRCLFLLAV